MILKSKNKLIKIFVSIIVITLISIVLPVENSYATLSSSKAKVETYVDSFKTGDKSGLDFVNVTTDGSKINIEYKSILSGQQYGLSLRKVGKSTVVATKEYFSANGEFSKTINTSYLSDGTYYLMVARWPIGASIPSGQSQYYYVGGTAGYCFIGVPIKVTNHMATIIKYTNVYNNNATIRKTKTSSTYRNGKYKDTSLKDIEFVFNDPYSNKKSIGTTTTKMKSYFKTASNSIVKGNTSDYDKMRAIYAYLAGNFYYDTVAFSTGKGQYVNPYRNLYNLRNNKSYKNSAKTSGKTAKVATTCIGMASMVAALGRAQGIPVRVIYGHALTSPWNTWNTESSISTLDHWWAEAYVDGRWIVVDPTRGTNATWNRSTGEYRKAYEGVLTYNYFDPSQQFLSNTHLYFGIK